MITAKEAKIALNKKYPSLTVLSGIDYDTNYYVFEAVEDTTKTDYNLPFYAVDKKNGKVYSFSPMDDLDKFDEAYEKRRLKV